jgi:hypothetical protein
MQDNYFTRLGLPCRHTDDRTVHDAFRHQRRVWFLRQYQPTHFTQAPDRLLLIQHAFDALGRETDRRRYLSRLLSSDRILKDRRRSELRRLAGTLAQRRPLDDEARALLRTKARALGLSEADADRVFNAKARPPRPAPVVGPRNVVPSSKHSHVSPSWSALKKFRFAVRVAVSQGPLDDRRRRHLLSRACHLGLALERAELVLEQAESKAVLRRPGWLERLWRVLRGNLDLDAR